MDGSVVSEAANQRVLESGHFQPVLELCPVWCPHASSLPRAPVLSSGADKGTEQRHISTVTQLWELSKFRFVLCFFGSQFVQNSVETSASEWFQDLVKAKGSVPSGSNSYQVQKILGSGSYGTVALCHKNNADQKVALKVVKNPDREGPLMKYLSKFGSASHHIVQWFCSFNFNGHVCHEYEVLDISLGDFLKTSSTLPLHRIRPILTQMNPHGCGDLHLFVDLMKRLLDMDPYSRIDPQEVLDHPFTNPSFPTRVDHPKPQ
uniref:Protein kinase domain-containing protein n=1 Tax=Knipowitschia caucasica TaxID=637954 RepID=A0AAV2K9F5_KNICA